MSSISINQSINRCQSINADQCQSINQSVSRSVDWSINQSIESIERALLSTHFLELKIYCSRIRKCEISEIECSVYSTKKCIFIIEVYLGSFGNDGCGQIGVLIFAVDWGSENNVVSGSDGLAECLGGPAFGYGPGEDHLVHDGIPVLAHHRWGHNFHFIVRSRAHVD